MDMMAVTVPKDLDESSAADFHFGVEEHINFNTQRGYGNLVAAWGSDVDVSLNTRVESVDWSGKEVLVNTNKGPIRGRCVISTVSTGILAAQHIHFIPRLPDWKMDAIQELTMGAENKIGVHFTKDVFAPEASGYYQVWSDDAHGAYVDVNLVSTNVVTVFIGGRFSIWMEQQGQQAAVSLPSIALQRYSGMTSGSRPDVQLPLPGSQTPGHWAPTPRPILVNFTNVNHCRFRLTTNCFLRARQLLVRTGHATAPSGQESVQLVKYQRFFNE
jgi:hypothetical protein